MVQIKLQEQLVQRHKKLQEAIVQQQKELQAVQQQLLVAQQFLIHSNPYLQGLLPPTSQPGGCCPAKLGLMTQNKFMQWRDPTCALFLCTSRTANHDTSSHRDKLG